LRDWAVLRFAVGEVPELRPSRNYEAEIRRSTAMEHVLVLAEQPATIHGPDRHVRNGLRITWGKGLRQQGQTNRCFKCETCCFKELAGQGNSEDTRDITRHEEWRHDRLCEGL